MSTPKCQICQDNKQEEIDALFREGLSLRKTSEATGYSIQNLRTHKKHATIESELAAPESFARNVNAQHRRLLKMLHEVRRTKPDDYDLILKVESELGKVARQILSMNESSLAQSALNEKALVRAEIQSVTSKILEAVGDCTHCKQNISNALNSLES